MKNEIRAFIEYLHNVRHTSENTVASYQRDLQQLYDYLIIKGTASWGEVTEDMLSGYISMLSEQHFAAATVSRHIASIKSFFHFLMENGDVKEDAADILKAPKVEKKLPRVLTPAEVDLLLMQPDNDTAKGKRDHAMLELLYATGMRVTELISLKVEDLDFRINCVICHYGNKERMIPFGQKAREALLGYLKDARDGMLQGRNENVLFLNCADGKSMSRQGFWKLLKVYAQKAEIKADITPYTVRHTFAAHLLENGADLKSVQEMLGHADISTTARYAGSRHNYIREIYERAQIRG